MKWWGKGKLNQKSVNMQIVKLTEGSLIMYSSFITNTLAFSY